jgi:hypothetical protein
VSPAEKLALPEFSAPCLPLFCHHPGMGQLLIMPQRGATEHRQSFRGLRPASDPGAAARGVLLALGLSCLAWIALALLVPRLW